MPIPSLHNSAQPILDQAADHQIRKMMGHSYLQTGRLAEALALYCGVLAEHPQDSELLCVVGTLYLLSGNPKTAETLLLLAREAAPSSLLIQRQLTLARSLISELSLTVVEAAPLAEDAVQRLVARLSQHRCPEMQRQISAAAAMVEQLGPVELPAAPVGSFPDHMMPALIEQNIRQATAAYPNELTEALRCLQAQLNAGREG